MGTKNHTSFKKGHLVKDEWREAARAANLGSARHNKPHSEATKLKISASRKGLTAKENNPAWKGGVKSDSVILRTKFRKQIQAQVLARDNYTCQICDQYGGSLQVDHIKSWADYPDLRFEVSNCRTLCMACHYYVTFKKKMPTGIVWGHNLNRRIA